MINLILSESEAMALRRNISRNLPEAPEKDKKHLQVIYKWLCASDEKQETGDLFI